MVNYRYGEIAFGSNTDSTWTQHSEGSDRLCLVSANFFTGNDFGAINGSVDGISVGGVGASLLAQISMGGTLEGPGDLEDFTYSYRVQLWGALGPPLGDISIISSGSGEYQCQSIIANNVLQSDPYGTLEEYSGGGTVVSAPTVVAPGEGVVQLFSAERQKESAGLSTVTGFALLATSHTGVPTGYSTARVGFAGAEWANLVAQDWELRQIVLHTTSAEGDEEPPTTFFIPWVAMIG